MEFTAFLDTGILYWIFFFFTSRSSNCTEERAIPKTEPDQRKPPYEKNAYLFRFAIERARKTSDHNG